MTGRPPGLIALSHEHHHGLVLALRLRQGSQALLTEGWTHDKRAQARRVLGFEATTALSESIGRSARWYEDQGLL